MQKTNYINLIERLVACLTYPTCGFLGLIFLILSNWLFKKNPKPITLYHIYQSFLIWMFIMAITFVLSLFIDIIIKIPVIGTFFANIILFFNTPIHFGMSIINLFIVLITIYLMLGGILGRYTKIPFISKIVKWNIDKRC